MSSSFLPSSSSSTKKTRQEIYINPGFKTVKFVSEEIWTKAVQNRKVIQMPELTGFHTYCLRTLIRHSTFFSCKQNQNDKFIACPRSSQFLRCRIKHTKIRSNKNTNLHFRHPLYHISFYFAPSKFHVYWHSSSFYILNLRFDLI